MHQLFPNGKPRGRQPQTGLTAEPSPQALGTPTFVLCLPPTRPHCPYPPAPAISPPLEAGSQETGRHCQVPFTSALLLGRTDPSPETAIHPSPDPLPGSGPRAHTWGGTGQVGGQYPDPSRTSIESSLESDKFLPPPPN